MRQLSLLLALCAVGCAPEEPAWQEGELGEWQPGLSVGAAGGCSTFIVDGLSQQLIAEQNCIRPGALVSFKGAAGISLGSNVYPFLEQKAHDGLVAAGKAAGLSVTSAFRTLAQQVLLYRWYQNGQCGISLAAVPGNSNHETGIAVDLGNYSSVIGTMSNHGFTHSYPSSDPVHFDYTAGGTIDLRAESVMAFQKLWNLNDPGDKIAEDGSYGPQTAARVAKAPVDGFAKGSTCAVKSNPAPSNPPAPAPSTTPSTPPSTTPSTTPSTPPSTTPPAVTTPDFAAELEAQGGPTRLAPGKSAVAWVEFRNTGAKTWTPSTTFLGTSGPHDRMSALAGPGWVSANRPAAVEHDTAPGEVGRFAFTLVAPEEPASFSESFGLVEEGVTWFDNVDYTLELEVVSNAGRVEAARPGPDGNTTSSGCAVGGAPDASPLFSLLLLAFYGRQSGRQSGRRSGRRRARDIP